MSGAIEKHSELFDIVQHLWKGQICCVFEIFVQEVDAEKYFCRHEIIRRNR